MLGDAVESSLTRSRDVRQSIFMPNFDGFGGNSPTKCFRPSCRPPKVTSLPDCA